MRSEPTAPRVTYESRFWDKQVAEGRRISTGNWYTEVSRWLWEGMMDFVGDLGGKRVLFVGCGESSAAAVEMADRGATVWCVDISPASIGKIIRHAEAHRAHAVHAIVADAEHMPFKDGSFQIVVGKAVLHHLEVQRFMAELRRVCSPGGIFVFSEPLGTNPLINLFRRLTPTLRVPTEHPFTRDDIEGIRRHCASLRLKHSLFLALGSLPWFLVGLRPLGRFFFRLLRWADQVLFAVCPPTRWLAWNVTLAGRVTSG